MFPRQHENIAITEETFSTRSVPIYYKQDQLLTLVKRPSIFIVIEVVS
jgi:hypothetical protein